jgi:hypothetical protein
MHIRPTITMQAKKEPGVLETFGAKDFDTADPYRMKHVGPTSMYIGLVCPILGTGQDAP